MYGQTAARKASSWQFQRSGNLKRHGLAVLGFTALWTSAVITCGVIDSIGVAGKAVGWILLAIVSPDIPAVREAWRSLRDR